MSFEQQSPKQFDGIYVGKMLYGYCNGFFGRDSYEDKCIEAFGPDWIIARDEDGYIHFASFGSEWQPKMLELINKWSIEES